MTLSGRLDVRTDGRTYFLTGDDARLIIEVPRVRDLPTLMAAGRRAGRVGAIDWLLRSFDVVVRVGARLEVPLGDAPAGMRRLFGLPVTGARIRTS